MYTLGHVTTVDDSTPATLSPGASTACPERGCHCQTDTAVQGVSRRSHITPTLRRLLVKYGIVFKIATLTN